MKSLGKLKLRITLIALSVFTMGTLLSVTQLAAESGMAFAGGHN